MAHTAIFNKNMEQAECAIIMPIYNRAHFLSQAFTSLREQTYTNWRLIIVDDGSSDNPLDVIQELVTLIPHNQVLFIHQKNGGAGAARATGQRYLEQEAYVAFYDSDDFWLATYLEDQISILMDNSEIDWIFCPCKRVYYDSGEVIAESTFYEDNGAPLDFLRLDAKKSGEAYIFNDPILLAKTHIRQPINAGFQNSVIRNTVAKAIAIPPCRIGEDRQFLLLAIAKNFNIAYTNKANVIYHVHNENVSATNSKDKDREKLIRIYSQLADSYIFVQSKIEQKVLKEAIECKVTHIKFWLIAYNIYWLNGEYRKSIKLMRDVLINSSYFSFSLYKTFLVSCIKYPFLAFK
ncbi:MAG: glycosyltransferase [Alishewanella agri]|nr:glycosyltransferase [Alishewanella agri]